MCRPVGACCHIVSLLRRRPSHRFPRKCVMKLCAEAVGATPMLQVCALLLRARPCCMYYSTSPCCVHVRECCVLTDPSTLCAQSGIPAAESVNSKGEGNLVVRGWLHSLMCPPVFAACVLTCTACFDAMTNCSASSHKKSWLLPFFVRKLRTERNIPGTCQMQLCAQCCVLHQSA